MSIHNPIELMETYGRQRPEDLAVALGFRITRQESSPVLPGVTVLSEYHPGGQILLYGPALRQKSAQLGQPPARVEQWHIAHELYHGLAEQQNLSPWRVRETAADLWADELLALMG